MLCDAHCPFAHALREGRLVVLRCSQQPGPNGWEIVARYIAGSRPPEIECHVAAEQYIEAVRQEIRRRAWRQRLAQAVERTEQLRMEG